MPAGWLQASRATLSCQPWPLGLAGRGQPWLPPPVLLAAPACSTTSKSSLRRHGRHQSRRRAGSGTVQDLESSQGRDLRLSSPSRGRLRSWETLRSVPASPQPDLEHPLAGARAALAAANLAQTQVSTPTPRPPGQQRRLAQRFHPPWGFPLVHVCGVNRVKPKTQTPQEDPGPDTSHQDS